MWWSLQFSYWLTLLLAIPTAGFLLRLFVLQHDCGHGAFVPSKWANNWMGSVLGILTMTPYHRWRKNHAIHHATSGNLDRRGKGDVHMLTVREYMQLSRWQRFGYRLHRHPVMLFGVLPVLYFVIWQRFVYTEPREWKKERLSVYLTNTGIVATLLLMGMQLGLWPLLLVHLPVITLASSMGVWLFYVQHHFEAAYWQPREKWSYFDAGLAGSSYYELPKVLQWMTANIGLHHIHHLDSQIPNYCLQQCHAENPILQQAAIRLTLKDSLSCISLKLWDEETERMVPIPRV
jgi:omega-6 fatty acid desaturase (delta-12 desaturase)